MVANIDPSVGRTPNENSENRSHIDTPSTTKSTTSEKETFTNVCSEIVRQQHETRGFSEEASKVIQSIRSEKTYGQYSAHIDQWFRYAESKDLNPLAPEPYQITNFLEFYRLRDSLSFSTINTARSALSAIISYEDVPIGQHKDVVIYMRALERLFPKTPKYRHVWDPGMVLRYLTRWSPAEKLDLRLLSYKLVMLILLATGQRVQTMAKMAVDKIQFRSGKAIIRIDDKLKTSTPGQPTYLEIQEYPANRSLCPLKYLKEYMKRTKHKRSSSRLFVACNKPHHEVTSQTLARWAKTVLKVSGVSNKFGAHSTRAASTSVAFYQGVPLHFIMQCASWKQENTFRKWYKKPVQSDNNFQVKVFDTHK